MLKVRDIMATDVAAVTPEMSVQELARFWSSHGISGAPVVDDSRRVIGVVSSTDLIRLTAEGPTHPGLAGTSAPSFPPEEVQAEGEEASWYWFQANEAPALYAEDLAEGLDERVDAMTVRDIMTPVAFDIRPDASVAELAAFLQRGKIHRALVMEDGELVGIVTTFDVLGAVAERPEFGG